VLNSLSFDYIAVSTALLVEGGHFEEIGKINIWNLSHMDGAASAVQYDVLALDNKVELERVWVNSTLGLLSSRARSSVVHGLPRQCYDLERDVISAFRRLQKGQNIGKIVVRVKAVDSLDLQGSHVITGGSGALGQIFGRWLVEAGAGSVVLASRRGTAPAHVPEGCDIHVARCDNAQPADVRVLMPHVSRNQAQPLSGVWHAAGLLADGLSMMMSAATLRLVYSPKAHGAWLLQQSCASAPLWRVCSSHLCLRFSAMSARPTTVLLTAAWTRSPSAALLQGRRLRACSLGHGQTQGWQQTLLSSPTSQLRVWG
jgi:hypothetical protein